MPAINKWVKIFIYATYFAFFIGIIFGLRAILSTSCITLSFLGFFWLLIFKGSDFPRLPLWFLGSCCLLYVVLAFGLLYTSSTEEVLRHLELKSILVGLPLSFVLLYKRAINTTILYNFFLVTLLAAIFYCLAVASWQYHITLDANVFFYHELVRPVFHHAVQFSILCFIGLAILLNALYREQFIGTRSVSVFLCVVIFSFILLLASKLIISLSVCWIIFYTYLFGIKVKSVAIRRMLFVIPVLLLLGISFTKNPIRSRFMDLMNGQVAVANTQVFTPGDYFNGLQFRLLQWKFVFNILNERKAWLLGVSAGDGQRLLNEQYLRAHMYSGDAQHNNSGYLGLNAHNEFLESLLITGIVGLIVYLMIITSLVLMAFQKKHIVMTATVLVLLCYSFTESVLETQFSLAIFCFFPLFIYLSNPERNEGHIANPA